MKPELKKIFLLIGMLNLIAIITKVPYWGREWDDPYFAYIRTMILGYHYVILTSFSCLYYKLLSNCSIIRIILCIPTAALHIAIIALSIDSAIFFWTCI